MPEFDYPYDPNKFVPPPEWRLALPRPWPFWAILGGFGFCFALIDFSYCWVVNDPLSWQYGSLWRNINIGAVGAQAGLLLIYAVWGPGRIWLRHAVALLLGSGCLLMWLFGYVVADSLFDSEIFPYSDVREICSAMLVIPALFLVGCVPLWILRTLFRWRIELQLPGQTDARPPQLSIAGILSATFIVAVALTLVRLGAYTSEIHDEADWWLGTAIGVAFTAGLSVFVLPVSTWGILRSRYLALGIAMIAFWLGIVFVGLFALGSVIGGKLPTADELLMLIEPLTSLGILLIFLLGPLIVCRCFHYRLVVGRQQQQTLGAAFASEI
jgi:hypothetical protein